MLFNIIFLQLGFFFSSSFSHMLSCDVSQRFGPNEELLILLMKRKMLLMK